MKRYGSWLALVALVVSAMVLAGCAPKQKALSDAEAYKRFIGTWVNTDYRGTVEQSQVTVIRPDYVLEDWQFPDSTGPAGRVTIRVKKTWVDEKGNTYCQTYNTRTHPESMRHSVAALMRVDKKGEAWEICIKPSGFGILTEDTAVYPEKIDSNLQYYYIYYRKK